MPRYLVKSQLYSDAESQLKGSKQILDDCTWSSCAAVITWASAGAANPSAAEAVIVMKKVTGRKDVQGKSDNGGSLAEAAKVIAALGGKARYAKSWEDAVTAAKAGAALMVWVQQGPAFYPAGVKISAWHDRWVKWWTKNAPEKIKAGYGHMTSAGWCEDHGWQWACPTRDEKVAAEKYGVPVTEEQLRQIANSKFKAKKAGVDYKCLLIVTYPKKAAAPAPVAAPVAVPEPVVAPAPVNAGARVAVAEQPKDATPTREVQPLTASTTPEPKKPSAVDAQLEALGKVDFGAVAGRAFNAASGAAAAAAKVKGAPAKMMTFLQYIKDNTGIDEALIEFVRTFVTVSISVALGLGIPLLDINGGDFRTVVSAGLASGLQVLVKYLDPKNSAFGIKEKN
jgi:hypothetical protein